MVAMYRQRATAIGMDRRCLVCGRKGVNPTMPPKVVSEYECCGNHLWGQIRAAVQAVKLGLDSGPARDVT